MSDTASTEISVKPRDSDIPPIDVEELTNSKFPADQWKADQPAWHRKPSPAYPVETGMTPHAVGQPYVPDPTMPLIGQTPWAGRIVAAGIVSIPAGAARVIGSVSGPAPSAMTLTLQGEFGGLSVVASDSSQSGFPIPSAAPGLVLPVAGAYVFNGSGAPVVAFFLIVAHDRIGI